MAHLSRASVTAWRVLQLSKKSARKSVQSTRWAENTWLHWKISSSRIPSLPFCGESVPKVHKHFPRDLPLPAARRVWLVPRHSEKAGGGSWQSGDSLDPPSHPVLWYLFPKRAGGEKGTETDLPTIGPCECWHGSEAQNCWTQVWPLGRPGLTHSFTRNAASLECSAGPAMPVVEQYFRKRKAFS